MNFRDFIRLGNDTLCRIAQISGPKLRQSLTLLFVGYHVRYLEMPDATDEIKIANKRNCICLVFNKTIFWKSITNCVFLQEGFTGQAQVGDMKKAQNKEILFTELLQRIIQISWFSYMQVYSIIEILVTNLAYLSMNTLR